MGIWRSDILVDPAGPGGSRTVELHPDGRYLSFDLHGFGEGTFTVDGSSVRFQGYTFDCPTSDGTYMWARRGSDVVLTPSASPSEQCRPTVLHPVSS